MSAEQNRSRVREALEGAALAVRHFAALMREVETCWRRYGRPSRDEWPAPWRAAFPGGDRPPGIVTLGFVHENQDEASAPAVLSVWAEVLICWCEFFPGWRAWIDRALASLKSNEARRGLGDDLLREVGVALVRAHDVFERLGPGGAGVAWAEGLAMLPEGWDGVVSVLHRARDVLREDTSERRGGGRATPRRRRVRGLTRLETEVFQAVGRCCGNYAQAARLLNTTRQSVRSAYMRALRKTEAISARSVRATRLAREPSADARLKRV